LTEQARDLGPGYNLVLDFGTFQDAPVTPGFATFAPPRSMRPSG
ncbi:MAG: hypothetical protein QOD24_885, partial [Solirubrobacteraceae bacterium]|nr:hypothetical protein [Solirubrobacteraceae bacterium]